MHVDFLKIESDPLCVYHVASNENLQPFMTNLSQQYNLIHSSHSFELG